MKGRVQSLRLLACGPVLSEKGSEDGEVVVLGGEEDHGFFGSGHGGRVGGGTVAVGGG